MPDPDKPTAGLFGQKTKPDIVTPKIKEGIGEVKEFLEDKNRPDFGIDFYE